jgi:hypothetical protein
MLGALSVFEGYGPDIGREDFLGGCSSLLSLGRLKKSDGPIFKILGCEAS